MTGPADADVLRERMTMSERRGWRCVGEGIWALGLHAGKHASGGFWWVYPDDASGFTPTLAEAQEAAERAAGIGQDEALAAENATLAAQANRDRVKVALDETHAALLRVTEMGAAAEKERDTLRVDLEQTNAALANARDRAARAENERNAERERHAAVMRGSEHTWSGVVEGARRERDDLRQERDRLAAEVERLTAIVESQARELREREDDRRERWARVFIRQGATIDGAVQLADEMIAALDAKGKP